MIEWVIHWIAMLVALVLSSMLLNYLFREVPVFHPWANPAVLFFLGQWHGEWLATKSKQEGGE